MRKLQVWLFKYKRIGLNFTGILRFVKVFSILDCCSIFCAIQMEFSFVKIFFIYILLEPVSYIYQVFLKNNIGLCAKKQFKV